MIMRVRRRKVVTGARQMIGLEGWARTFSR
jgi:hypothetical protein